jgi:MoaA/NifB/PqqE/SkfB family radical SAM enzyme
MADVPENTGNISEATLEQPDRDFHVIQIHPSLRCNLTCKHCYSSSGPQFRSGLDIADVDAFLQYAQHYGFNVMSVSGGEPFLYPLLNELLSVSREAGYKNLAASNGMLLKSARAQSCLAQLDLIAISIDGKEPFHDTIRDQPGAYKKMLDGVVILRQHGRLFGFIHTITSKSWEILLWLAEFAHQQGAKLLQLHPLELTGRAAIEFNHLAPSQEALHKVYIISHYLKQKYAGKMAIQLDFLHRLSVLHAPEMVSYFGPDFKLNEGNFARVVRSLIVDHNGNIFPLSYGFSERFRIGQISDIKNGHDLFKKFIQQKGDAFYSLLQQTFHQIESEEQDDMIAWTERIVAQSNQKTINTEVLNAV